MSEARELLKKVIDANGLFGDLKEEIDAYLAKPEPEEVDMSNKTYVLLYKDGQYFKNQNLYLGHAILTNDIDSAKQMTLEEAEKKYRCMKEKDDWNIFSVVIGLRLGEESIRHIKAARKAELEKELAAIGEI